MTRRGTGREQQHLLQTLQGQVRQLEATYKELLQLKELKEACAFLADVPGFGSEVESQEPQKTDKLRELSEVKLRLRRQNSEMRVAVAKYERYEASLQFWLDRDMSGVHEDTASITLTSQHSQRATAIPSLRVPLTQDECRKLSHDMFAEICQVRESPAFLTTGASVFGWRDKRHVDGDMVNFILSKTFHGVTALNLLCRGWSYMSSPKHMAMLYSTAVAPRVYPIQRIDANNIVLMRVFSSPDGVTQVKSLFLAARFEIPTGRGVIYRTLDASLLSPYENPPGVQEHWVIHNSWVALERVGDAAQHSQVSFGGEVTKALAVVSDAWMLEVLYIAMRWESLVLGSGLLPES